VDTECLLVSDDSIARAAELLRDGELVAFPTETVYGLGARLDDPEAVGRIFAAKQRPADKALIAHVLDIAQARPLAAAWPKLADELARTFWPGPLTVVVRRSDRVPDAVTAGGETVAIRAPDHPTAKRLLQALGIAIAAPSANIAGAPPPTTAAEVVRGLGGRIRMVLDGGPTPLKTPSTIVDLSRLDPTGTGWTILREGAISREAVAAVVGRR
jgi:L-threonylcarbamoyladenylate synthase